MRLSLLGGTGDIGKGLALRFAADTDHDVIIGSRDPDKAHSAAESYEQTLAEHGHEAKITGFENPMAADRADCVVLAVPPYHVTDTLSSVVSRLSDDAVIITPAAGLTRDEDGFHYRPPSAGSVTTLVADAAPESNPVVGAFHNLAAGRLADLSLELGIDTLVLGDDRNATEMICTLIEEIDGLRALKAGPLANAAEVESLTPLLINIAQQNDGLHDLGVQFK
ncbi:MAG: NADPH-dependent F420 reductase [Haloquadratum sp. J07HQX50]|nr:MAG: NADPH-dependent F420 reductase [Haloquadratum sp. J07HQX50]